MNSQYPAIGTSIRALASGVFDSMEPCRFERGVVTSVEPLSIQLTQDFNLTEEFLTLTNAVKDYSVDVTVSWSTESEDQHKHTNGNDGKPTDSGDAHKHEIKGRKKIVIHNGLTVGEVVLLLREQGGQNYIVVDRLSMAEIKGEWL